MSQQNEKTVPSRVMRELLYIVFAGVACTAVVTSFWNDRFWWAIGTWQAVFTVGGIFDKGSKPIKAAFYNWIGFVAGYCSCIIIDHNDHNLWPIELSIIAAILLAVQVPYLAICWKNINQKYYRWLK